MRLDMWGFLKAMSGKGGRGEEGLGLQWKQLYVRLNDWHLRKQRRGNLDHERLRVPAPSKKHWAGPGEVLKEGALLRLPSPGDNGVSLHWCNLQVQLLPFWGSRRLCRLSVELRYWRRAQTANVPRPEDQVANIQRCYANLLDSLYCSASLRRRLYLIIYLLWLDINCQAVSGI